MSCPKLIISLWQRLINRWIIVLLPMIDWFGKQSLLLNQMIVVFVEHDHSLGRQITLREHLRYLSFRSPTLVRILLESAVLDVLNLLFLWINKFYLAFFLAFENILQKFLQFWVNYHTKDPGEIFLFLYLGYFLIVFLLFLLDLLLFGIFGLLLLRWWNLFYLSLSSFRVLRTLRINWRDFSRLFGILFTIFGFFFFLVVFFWICLFLFLLFLRYLRFNLGLFTACEEHSCCVSYDTWTFFWLGHILATVDVQSEEFDQFL